MLKNKKLKALITTSLVTTFLLSMTGTVFGESRTETTRLDYVALGDSLAAGHNPYNSPNGYGYTNIIQNNLAKARASSNFQNFGVSGLTSNELLTQVTSDPKMKKFISNAEIITLDIGANDLLPLLEDYFIDPKPEKLALIKSEVPKVLTNIQAIITSIQTINNNAKIYVMGYYNPFIKYPLLTVQMPIFSELLKEFNFAIQSGVDPINIDQKDPLCNVTYVNTMSVIDKPEYLPGDIHLTVEGYSVIANEFLDKIASDFNITFE